LSFPVLAAAQAQPLVNTALLSCGIRPNRRRQSKLHGKQCRGLSCLVREALGEQLPAPPLGPQQGAGHGDEKGAEQGAEQGAYRPTGARVRAWTRITIIAALHPAQPAQCMPVLQLISRGRPPFNKQVAALLSLTLQSPPEPSSLIGPRRFEDSCRWYGSAPNATAVFPPECPPLADPAAQQAVARGDDRARLPSTSRALPLASLRDSAAFPLRVRRRRARQAACPVARLPPPAARYSNFSAPPLQHSFPRSPSCHCPKPPLHRACAWLHRTSTHELRKPSFLS
jgi:hypothetical protein